MRFLERRKTDTFQARQRSLKLLIPGALCLIAVIWDIVFLTTWDPYREAGSPLAPVGTAWLFLALNFLLVRVLLYVWAEVKWVFLGPLAKRAPIFIIQAALFAAPFTPPLLAAWNYTPHERKSFQRRFPACVYSRIVDKAPAARRFEDSEYLYCLYARPTADGSEVRLLRCRRDAHEAVRRAREPGLRATMDPKGPAPDREEMRRREREALKGTVDNVLVADLPRDQVETLELRIWGGRLLAAFTTKRDPSALRVCMGEDHGAVFAPPVEVETNSPLVVNSRVPSPRNVQVRSRDAFVGGLKGVDLSRLRPSQIVETPDAVHVVRFEDKGLTLARYDKRTETWRRPLKAKAKTVERLNKDLDTILGRSGQRRRVRALPFARRAGSGGSAASSSRVGRLDKQVKRLQARLDGCSGELTGLVKRYGGDETKLELIEKKLFDLEEQVESLRRPASARSPAKPEADPLGFQDALRLMNLARDNLYYVQEGIETVGTMIEETETQLREAKRKLDRNSKLINSLGKHMEKEITKAFEQEGKRATAERRSKAVYRAMLVIYERWRKLQEARRELMMKTRGPVTLRLKRAQRRLAEADRQLALARKGAAAVRGKLKALRERLDLPLLPISAPEADRKRDVAIAFATTDEDAAPPLVIRYWRPVRADQPGAPAPREPAYLVNDPKRPDEWRPTRAEDLPAVDWGRDHTFLFGTTHAGVDIVDRLIAGSWFYFNPAVILPALLGAFALCSALAFLNAIVSNPRVRWQYVLFRKGVDTLVESVASAPAIIVLIVVVVAWSAYGQKGYAWAVTLAIVVTQLPNLYQYVRDTMAEYEASERLAHDLSMGMSWSTVIVRKILMDRCLRIFIIQAFYILGYVILFETTLSYLGFTPPGDIDSWGKLLVDQGKQPMTRFIQTGVPGPNDWVFWAPLAAILVTIYSANRIGKLLTHCLLGGGGGRSE